MKDFESMLRLFVTTLPWTVACTDDGMPTVGNIEYRTSSSPEDIDGGQDSGTFADSRSGSDGHTVANGETGTDVDTYTDIDALITGDAEYTNINEL